MGRKRQIIISVLALLSLTLVTTGVSYSLLDYDEEGVQSELSYNYLGTPGITQLSIQEVTPLTDEQGKKLVGDGELFRFSVDGTIEQGKEVPYEITVARDPSSTLSGDLVKVYLTEVVNGVEHPINVTTNQNGTIKKYTELTKSSLLDTWENRIVYQGTADYGYDGTFHRDYNLRIWVDENTDVKPITLEDGTISYPYQGKIFTLKVNVTQKEH